MIHYCVLVYLWLRQKMGKKEGKKKINLKMIKAFPMVRIKLQMQFFEENLLNKGLYLIEIIVISAHYSYYSLLLAN